MSYTSPHHAREFVKAAALRVCHDYKLHFLGTTVTPARMRRFLEDTNEVDLQAKVGDYFGMSAHLRAQGAARRPSPVRPRPLPPVDLYVAGPLIHAEIKYFCAPAPKNWGLPAVNKDWAWLLEGTNAASNIKKKVWVVFWPHAQVPPSEGLFPFRKCLSGIPKSHGPAFSLEDIAPFEPYVEVVMPPHGTNQRLEFKKPKRRTILDIPGGKHVLVEIVGSHTDPLWCAVYPRVTPSTAAKGQAGGIPATVISDDRITI